MESLFSKGGAKVCRAGFEVEDGAFGDGSPEFSIPPIEDGGQSHDSRCFQEGSASCLQSASRQHCSDLVQRHEGEQWLEGFGFNGGG